MAYKLNGEIDSALHHFRLIRENTELYIDSQIQIAYILDALRRHDEAIVQMRKVLEIEPDHAEALNFIGYTYAEKGIRLDEALDLIQRALLIEPDSGAYIDSLGWVYFQQGLYDKALDTLKKAFSHRSDDSTIAEHLGDVYLKKEEYSLSLEMYQKALDLDHQDVDKIRKKMEEVKKLME
jgi:tetratricopeptide (TPR) repeat protein